MSTYFDRIEHHLLDAVERQARPRASAPRPARTRIAVATAAGLAAIVALAVAGLLAALGGSGADRAALDRPQTLNDALAVLRRDQRPGDAPATVVFAAIQAAQTAPAPYRGIVDTGGVRRLVAGGPASGDLRLYLAPMRGPGSAAPQSPDRAAGGAQAALVFLTDADDRPVQYPYGLTAHSLRSDRAWYIAYGLRAEPGLREKRAAAQPERDADAAAGVRSAPDAAKHPLMRMRSLQLQIVPDGVARVAYRYPASQIGPRYGGAATIVMPVAGNAAATVLGSGIANRYPATATMHDARGEVVGRAAPVIRGRGPIAPQAICRGVELPARPSGRPVIPVDGTTLRALCRQAGLPQEVYRRDSGYALLLWPDGTVIGRHDDGKLGEVWHLAPGGEFPPRFTDVLAPAEKLGHYPAASQP